MIKVENIDVWGFEHAIRGMRNPLNSWNKSDSIKCYANEDCQGICKNNNCGWCIGSNDLDLMRRLYNAGPEHRKYLRQIFVSMDIIAPLYWWKEMDQYRINVTTNSCSTMHKLMSKPFEMNDFSFEKLPGYKNEIKQFIPEITEDMIANEIWLKYDDDYEVSSFGRVRHVFNNTYRILGGSKHADSYIYVTLHGTQIPLHRLIAMCFHPDTYDEELFVNHIDGNKMNNFADNLEWVTQKENIAHSYANNLQPKPYKTYTGKFSQEERDTIKKLWNDGAMSKRKIAELYGVSHTCICDIINDRYKYSQNENLYETIARPTVDRLNEMRDSWLNQDNPVDKKTIWYSTVQLLPSSYNQRRTITMNYENVMTIINQRTGHKLDEWNEFVDILYDLPYVREIRSIAND